MAILMKAAPVAEVVYQDVRNQVQEVLKKRNLPPKLATVLVGEDTASKIYVTKKGQMCTKLGMAHEDIHHSGSVSQEELLATVDRLNKDETVDGILVQSPLPPQCNEKEIFSNINPDKDVDCFSSENVGKLVQKQATLLPCTPAGIIEILKFYKIEMRGRNALVIGRSDIVGKPTALLLLHQDATVTIAHSKTQNLKEHVRSADIIICAIGKANFLDSSFEVKESAALVDVGINRNSAGKVVGDIDFSHFETKARAITPVPGGVGPMTIAMLMRNTACAALLRGR
ncbi:MAG: bifunctional 5,10-methylenetetrahydrofolate dehydrogenase/5,10-methenyltetrahydrofolate cyclohydrolase [Bacteriovoracia bacterium]